MVCVMITKENFTESNFFKTHVKTHILQIHQHFKLPLVGRVHGFLLVWEFSANVQNNELKIQSRDKPITHCPIGHASCTMLMGRESVEVITAVPARHDKSSSCHFSKVSRSLGGGNMSGESNPVMLWILAPLVEVDVPTRLTGCSPEAIDCKAGFERKACSRALIIAISVFWMLSLPCWLNFKAKTLKSFA